MKTRRRRADGAVVCLECRKLWDKKWRKENPKRHAEIQRKRALKAMYGISPEQFEEMLAAINNLCPICNRYIQQKGDLATKVFAVVDHDHDTGEVRGIICNKCNSGIGMLSDNPETIRRALAYLERHDACVS